jgi:hypothetical protein
MAGLGLFGGKKGKLGFPEPEHVRLNSNDFTDLTDPEKELVWDFRIPHGISSNAA